MEFIRQTLNILFELLFVLIFLNVLFSWFSRDRHHPLVQRVNDIVEPILKPIRNALPRTGPLDFSPLIAFILLHIAQTLVNQFL